MRPRARRGLAVAAATLVLTAAGRCQSGRGEGAELVRHLLLLTALLLGSACGDRAPRPADGAGPSLLLVSIDTLRADRLGAWGYGRDTSPALDALAARGAVFERALTESGWTLPAHVTMLTGVGPAVHRVAHPAQRVPDGMLLVAEHLAARGFRTFGTTDGVFLDEQYGFGRGFERFDDARKGLAAALHQLRFFLGGLEEGERFFAFVHTYDVHCPYEPGPAWSAAFRSPDAEPFETSGRCGNPDFNEMVLTPGQRRHLGDLYDASIRAADEELGDLFAWLEMAGLADRTVVAVTSDHGEELGEHGRIGHERSVHAEILRVPWIVAGPGVPRGVRVPHAVGLVDLAPTLLDLVAAPPLPGAEGSSRVGWLAGAAEAPGGPLHSEVRWPASLDSVVDGDHHLVVRAETGAVELYDLAADPAEERDLAARLPGRAAELLRLAREHAARHAGRARAPTVADPTPEMIEDLRRLGYVE